MGISCSACENICCMNRRVRALEPEEGFTLIEILIVIVILAILAGIVVAATFNITRVSARTSCEASLKTVKIATQAYGAQVGHFPKAGDNAAPYPGGTQTTLSGVWTGAEALYATQIGQQSAGTVGPWLKDIASGNGHYTIVVSSDGTGAVGVDDSAGLEQADCSGVS